MNCDVVVVGAGFGGSLTALLLKQIGLKPILIERGSHPRFAIGESSTPLADLILGDLARRYDLPQLEPLTTFGAWQQNHPELAVGLKRGFSYFQHTPNQPFQAFDDHRNELLVAASSSDEQADTHWYRADVDRFFVEQAQAAGVPYSDRTEITAAESQPNWALRLLREGKSSSLQARFLIDATGPSGFLTKLLGIPVDASAFQTNSRTLYGHFENVVPFEKLLRDNDARIDEHPFPCDDAALHHILEDGWMWQLRFGNGITSAGFVLDNRQDDDVSPSLSPEEEWNQRLRRYPSIAQQFANARLVAPAGGIVRTGRLQRLAQHRTGENWAMLPYAAGFIDPLHSTGIAHTLSAIERLPPLLEQHWNRTTFSGALQQYGRSLHQELHLVDRLVTGCYRTLPSFPHLAAFTMLYFAAATTTERRRLANETDDPPAFLCADDPTFTRIVDTMLDELEKSTSAENFERTLAAAISDYNTAGLCDPSVRNMYRYTALPG